MKKLYFVLSVVALAFGTVLQAQVPAAPRELGMGGAYLGVARGFESIFLAPTNLALSDAPRWSFGFPQVAMLNCHGSPDSLCSGTFFGPAGLGLGSGRKSGADRLEAGPADLDNALWAPWRPPPRWPAVKLARKRNFR